MISPPVEFAVAVAPLTTAVKIPDEPVGKNVPLDVIGAGPCEPPPPVDRITEVFPAVLNTRLPEREPVDKIV